MYIFGLVFLRAFDILFLFCTHASISMYYFLLRGLCFINILHFNTTMFKENNYMQSICSTHDFLFVIKHVHTSCCTWVCIILFVYILRHSSFYRIPYIQIEIERRKTTIDNKTHQLSQIHWHNGLCTSENTQLYVHTGSVCHFILQ